MSEEQPEERPTDDTSEQFRTAFLEFLRERNRDPALEVDPDDNLFNRGLLDSFALPQLLVHLERRLGGGLGRQRGGVEAFFTINRALEVYVPAAERRA